jgi:two-component system sensor histidine kinase ResE
VAKDIEIKGTYLAVVVSPLNDRDGISGAVAVFRDVTNERKLDKLRSDFVANISHELRTPIAMLQGYSEAILDGIAATEEEQRELVKIIFDESVRMSKLVNELLDLARIEAGHLQLVPAKISLNQLLDKIGRKFNGLTRERRIQLTVDKLQGDDTVFLDQDRMEQVLTNLIDNAIRHTPDHGEIRVTPSKKEKILQIEVSDTGSGIDPEDIPYLFERFYKGDKARTRGRSGTGLGLSIVKNIVEAHKGHIYVESTLGEGTSFKIQIPQSD